MATSQFLVVGSTVSIPSPEVMDRTLTWFYDLANQEATLIVPPDQGVASMAAYRGEMIGFNVREKESGLLEPPPRLMVVMADELTEHLLGMIERAHEKKVPCYVFPVEPWKPEVPGPGPDDQASAQSWE